ncbi:MAG: ABC transporter ATP-binding protein [Rudaea sp.]
MAKTSTSEFAHLTAQNRLQGLWGLLRGFRATYSGAMGTLAIATVARTGTFLLIGYLVDQVLKRSDLLQVLPVVALGFILLALIQGGLMYVSGKLAARTAEGVALRLRNYLFDQIQRMSFTYHDHTTTGELIQRATSDVDAVRKFYGEQAIGISRILLLFLVNWITMLQLNLPLALYSVAVVPLVLVISLWFFRQISKSYERYQEQDARLSTTLQENLAGVRVVKAFARQEYEQGKFEVDNVEKYRRGVSLLRWHASFWPLTDTLCSAQLIAGYAIGAIMTINGQLTLGEYVAYSGVVGLTIWPMRELGRIIVQASMGMVSLGRVMDIIRQPREPIEEGEFRPEPGLRLRGLIEFSHVGFEYEKENGVLHDITFRAAPGQAIALLGPTGSGKTSLVNLLPRFYEYTSGHIKIDGIELQDIPRRFLRQQIGIVEQEPFLFSRTVRENITYGVGRQVSDAEVEAAARAAAIHDVILGFPEGYRTLVGEKGITLSGGQKQRVAIARTLLKDPRILILDDSTSSVDTETEAEIRSALEELMRGRTTFIIAHRIQSVMNADQILVLEKGSIIQRGTHEQLLTEPGLYRRIYELQARIEVEVEKEVGEKTGERMPLVESLAAD